MALGFCCLFFIGITDFSGQWNANNDAIETRFNALPFYRQRGKQFLVRCVIISKCCQNMPISPTSLWLHRLALRFAIVTDTLSHCRSISAAIVTNAIADAFLFSESSVALVAISDFHFKTSASHRSRRVFIISLSSFSLRDNKIFAVKKTSEKKRERETDRQKRWHEKREILNKTAPTKKEHRPRR